MDRRVAGLSPDDAPYSAAVSEDVAPVDVEHAVLLVMDFQPGIVERVADADALLDRVARAIATRARPGVAVGYVRVAFDDADYDALPPTNKILRPTWPRGA